MIELFESYICATMLVATRPPCPHLGACLTSQKIHAVGVRYIAGLVSLNIMIDHPSNGHHPAMFVIGTCALSRACLVRPQVHLLIGRTSASEQTATPGSRTDSCTASMDPQQRISFQTTAVCKDFDDR
jgi:hypothetical protein